MRLETERKRLVDGFSTLIRGVHEGLNPTLLPSNQAARLINATVRGGFPTCRPPFSQVELRFEDAEQEQWFETYNVQGRYSYRPAVGAPFLVVSVGGRVFKIDVTLASGTNVMELTDPTDPNPSIRRHVWMQQAEQYLIVQDGQSTPLIYDGASMRRSRLGEPDYEVPVGTAMAYGMGRLIVVRPHRRSYVIGDIVGGGTEVIQFTEENYLSEGGDVNVPVKGLITSVQIIAQLDRSTGQGDLIAMTRFGAASAKIGEKRETWKDIQFQQVAMLGSGAVSHNAMVQVNGDFFYRSADGIRSLAMTKRDFQSTWATTPLSREVNRTLSFDSPHWLEHCEGVLFDNRVLMLCNQTPIRNGAFHRGIVALDFDLISGMDGKQPPAYDGLWTGLNATAIVADEFPSGQRCFVFHRNSETGHNELWEIERTATGIDNGVNLIEWSIDGPSLLKEGTTPYSLKALVNGDISLEEVFGIVTVTVQFRPDQAPCYYDWREFNVCARKRECEGDCEEPVVHYQKQYRTKLRFGQPPKSCSASDNKPTTLGYQFQPRITITGKATVNVFRLSAIEQQEPTDGCTDSEVEE